MEGGELIWSLHLNVVACLRTGAEVGWRTAWEIGLGVGAPRGGGARAGHVHVGRQGRVLGHQRHVDTREGGVGQFGHGTASGTAGSVGQVDHWDRGVSGKDGSVGHFGN